MCGSGGRGGGGERRGDDGPTFRVDGSPVVALRAVVPVVTGDVVTGDGVDAGAVTVGRMAPVGTSDH